MATATKGQMRHQTRWFSLAVEPEERVADLMIYGDVVSESWRWDESEVSAYSLSKQLADLDVDLINVGINSYGGEIAEGLAIYNALKRHRAKVVTRCDGFACSIASVIFMAGDERVMADPSLLMIHNGLTYAYGNAAELRKAADDIEKMTNASVQIYLQSVSLDEDEVRRLMDEETWIAADEAVDMGFATSMEGTESDKPSQSTRRKVMQMLRNPYRQAEEEPEEPTDEPKGEPETTEEPAEEPETTDEEPQGEPTGEPEEPDDDEEPTAEQRFEQLLTTIAHM